MLRVGPWHQDVDVLGRMAICDAVEQVAQVGVGFHFILLAGADQTGEAGRIVAALVMACEQCIAAVHGRPADGVTNAFAVSCTANWKYVVLHSEIAVLAKDAPDFVRFVLAHELAHHKLGHVSLWRISVGIVMNMLFLPGKALIRAQEYSADRLALALCPGAADSILALVVGPLLATQINPDAFNRQIDEEEHRLMVRIANITSDHAVMSKRYRALRNIAENGFQVHGEMF